MGRGEDLARKDQKQASEEHRYPRRAAYVAAMRSVAGCVMALALWYFTSNLVFTVISVAVLLVFIGYGVVAVGRATSVLTLDDGGIGVEGWRSVHLPFSELTAIRLGYYTTRRDGERGWMELVVRAKGQRLVVESEIDGFRQIAEALYTTANDQGLTLSDVSERNFSVLLNKDATAGLEAGFAYARTAQ